MSSLMEPLLEYIEQLQRKVLDMPVRHAALDVGLPRYLQVAKLTLGKERLE